ncbi:uncharacterized protein LOC144045096 [Vanacampus margaritifer]
MGNAALQSTITTRGPDNSTTQYTSASMDPAGKWEATLRNQEEHLSHQEEFQRTMATQLGYISGQVQELVTHLRSYVAPPVRQELPPGPPAPTPSFAGLGMKLTAPERYLGDPGQSSWPSSLTVIFEHSPKAFPTDRSKVAFINSHLTGRARD